MIRVTVWNEYKHERELEAIREVYPEGIHHCIAEFLGKQGDLQIRTATFDMPEHGLTDEVLRDTDVLIIWSHALQDGFPGVRSSAPAAKTRNSLSCQEIL